MTPLEPPLLPAATPELDPDALEALAPAEVPLVPVESEPELAELDETELLRVDAAEPDADDAVEVPVAEPEAAASVPPALDELPRPPPHATRLMASALGTVKRRVRPIRSPPT